MDRSEIEFRFATSEDQAILTNLIEKANHPYNRMKDRSVTLSAGFIQLQHKAIMTSLLWHREYG